MFQYTENITITGSWRKDLLDCKVLAEGTITTIYINASFSTLYSQDDELK